jgi:putative flippase GtrA
MLGLVDDMAEINNSDESGVQIERPVGEAPGARRRLRDSRFVQRLIHHFPPGQFGRYLVVGVCNTIFGYSTYAGLTLLLTPHVRYAYMVANVVSGLINITFAFLSYKWFIFETKGNYLREWVRCLLVYGSAIAISTAALPLVVYGLRHLTPARGSAAYWAGAMLMGVTVIGGFLGHRNFSFAPRKIEAGNAMESK